VRLFTRRGYDWTIRYPAIAVTAALLRARSFTLDGEAVVCGPDGVAIFDAPHRRGTVTEAMLYAFDLLELDGEDLRGLSLADRKKRLARLLGRRRIGIVLSDHTAEDGALLFMHACRKGLQGIVSKKLSAPYRSGPSRDWIKVKNPDSPAMIRACFRLHTKHLSVRDFERLCLNRLQRNLLREQHVADGEPAFGCEAPLLHRLSVGI
jgi:bifunctional non-homologous end joining protein LigD